MKTRAEEPQINGWLMGLVYIGEAITANTAMKATHITEKILITVSLLLTKIWL